MRNAVTSFNAHFQGVDYEQKFDTGTITTTGGKIGTSSTKFFELWNVNDLHSFVGFEIKNLTTTLNSFKIVGLYRPEGNEITWASVTADYTGGAISANPVRVTALSAAGALTDMTVLAASAVATVILPSRPFLLWRFYASVAAGSTDVTINLRQ